MKFKNMLEKKLIALFFGSMIVMLVLQSLATNLFMESEINQWEIAELKNHKDITVNLMRNRFDPLTTLTDDYATWDSTFNLIENHVNGKTTTILTSEELPTSNLVAALLLDQSHNEIASTSIYKAKKQAQLVQGFLQTSRVGEDRGLIFIDKKMLMYVKKAVYDDIDRINTNGFLVFFREFSLTEIEDIISDVGTIFTLQVNEEHKGVERFSLKIYGTPLQKSIDVGDDFITGIYNFKMSNGAYLPLDLEIILEREIYKLFNLEVLIIFQVIGMLAITTFMWYQLRKLAIRPIVNMAKHLEYQGTIEEDYVPLKIRDNNEIDLLAENVNRLFAKVSQQHNFNQLLLDKNEDIIVTLSENNLIKYANPAAEVWFNKGKGGLIDTDINFALTGIDDNNYSLMYLIRAIFKNKVSFSEHIDLRNNYTRMNILKASVNGYYVKDEQTNICAVLIIIRVN